MVKQVHIFIQKALLHNTELVVLQSDVQNLSWQRRVGPFLAEWAFEPCPINLVVKEKCYGTYVKIIQIYRIYKHIDSSS